MKNEIDDETAKEWVEDNKHIFKAVDKIMKIITSLEPEEYEGTLIMVLSNCVMHGSDSEQEARETITRVGVQSILAVQEFDKMGLCAWNATRQ